MTRQIPPFAALRALEATARTGRVVDAADELCITHAAVSHQIRKLEELFEVELFTRHGDGMRPSAVAADYARSVSHAFDLLSDATAKMRSFTNRQPVRISSLSFFFETWLLPNIRAFWRDHPEIDVHAICTGSLYDIEPRDTETDLAIRVALESDAHWPGYDVRPLIPCDSMPLCSPSYLTRHGPIDTIDTLLECDLIHERDENDDDTAIWRVWLAATGHNDERVERGAVFSDVSQGVASAMLGEGVVLAPTALVNQHLRLGTLVAMDWFRVSELRRHYYLCWKSTGLRQNVEIVRDWLLQGSVEQPA
ncbi:MAG: LysR family transcriptional regulator [Rhodospirillaceae bacterium]|nr:LysR family transcriptional regulator [Rhodospirillaceae bacterium]MBT7648936.1 LysR family transcriptional regulator [Rhodospirillaceae bacterium]